jgi:xylulokinase
VLEATAFGFRHHLDVFAELGLLPRRLRVTNGGARGRLWKQVVADVTGQPLETLDREVGSELGAAFAAGVGAGVFSSWAEIERFISVKETVAPDSSTEERYRHLYAAYRALYPALTPVLELQRESA